MNGDRPYLDSSAIVKLVVEEPESSPLRAWIEQTQDHTSSALARTEVLRAVRRLGPADVERARSALHGIDLIAIDEAQLEVAALLEPPALRTLDAIHLAAALTLGDELLAIVTYDERMAEAARALGLPVAQPGIDETERER